LYQLINTILNVRNGMEEIVWIFVRKKNFLLEWSRKEEGFLLAVQTYSILLDFFFKKEGYFKREEVLETFKQKEGKN